MRGVSVPHWLNHPLAAALLRFNLLPASLGQALQDEPAGTPALDRLPPLPSLQRHRSAALLAQHGLDPVMGLDDPALPLALLPDAHFERLQRLLGAALHAGPIRRTIAREDRACLAAQLGREAQAMAGGPVAAQLAHLPSDPDWQPARAGAICRPWGAAVMGQAFDAAAPEVGRRAQWRLPPGTNVLSTRLAIAGLAPVRALSISLELLRTVEPAWISSFPSIR